MIIIYKLVTFTVITNYSNSSHTGNIDFRIHHQISSVIIVFAEYCLLCFFTSSSSSSYEPETRTILRPPVVAADGLKSKDDL